VLVSVITISTMPAKAVEAAAVKLAAAKSK
jgi:hypothetical protein